MLRLIATGAVVAVIFSASNASAQSPAYQAQYERAEAALTARQIREEEEEEKRCEAIRERAFARLANDLLAGDRQSDAIGAAARECQRTAVPMRQRHADQWALLDDAYERRWPLPNFEGDGPQHIVVAGTEQTSPPPPPPREINAREEAAIERKALEERMAEEKALLDRYRQSRDDHGTNPSLEADIAEAEGRVHSAEADYIDHLREHSPDEARAFQDRREQAARQMEDPQRMTEGQGPQRNPDQRPPVREIQEYDGPNAAQPDHDLVDLHGQPVRDHGPQRNPEAQRPPAVELQDYDGPKAAQPDHTLLDLDGQSVRSHGPPSNPSATRPSSPPLPTYSPPGGGAL